MKKESHEESLACHTTLVARYGRWQRLSRLIPPTGMCDPGQDSAFQTLIPTQEILHTLSLAHQGSSSRYR